MSARLATIFMVVSAAYFSIYFYSYDQPSESVLYENGTCINKDLTNSSEWLLSSNGTVGDYLNSLPSDNTILAEMICNH